METKAILKMQHRSKPKLLAFHNIGLAFIGALCLGWLAVWVLRIVQNINMPQIEYSESFVLYISQLFGTGQWSWDIAQPNGGYMVSFYTPMFYLVLGAIGNIFGYSLVAGRILVLLIFVICLVLIYLIVHHLTGRKVYSAIASLLPLTHPFINTWSLFLRVDLLSIMFELGAIYLVLKFWKSHWMLVSIPLFALAFYSKQSTLAGAAVVCIFILINNWRFAITYTVMLLLTIGIPLLIGSLSTHGQFFNEIFLYQRVSPFLRPWDQIQGYLTVAYIEMLAVLIIGLWYSLKNIRSLPGLFALIALLVNIVIIARPGGAQNYFFEVVLAMSIMTGWALPEILQARKWGLVLLFLGVLWSLTFNYQLTLYPEPEYDSNVKRAEEIIQDATFPILTENADIVVSAGKVPYDEPFVFTNLPQYGYWDENILLEDMRSGRMEYVITQYKMPSEAGVWRVDEAVQKTIVENYHVILDAEDKVGYGFVIYQNNQKQD